ncbi:MAG TPA: BamA/TamA family outer membrane protein [Labilithrix sp.]|nr:BamA/TamA family outer membrane protein [Labilithrix sp.]
MRRRGRTRLSTLLGGCAALGVTLGASAAFAQQPDTDGGPPPNESGAAAEPAKPATAAEPAKTEPAASAEAPPPAPPGGESPKRALPDYDGRGSEPTTAGDIGLWVPRVLVSPLYVLSEYVIRRPLGWLIATAEKKQWPAAIRDFFVFGPEKKAGIVPTFFLDLGFRPSVGVYAFWDDLLGPGNHLRLHFSTFGPDWIQAAVADKIPVGKDAFFDLRLEGVHRPDLVFHGLGPNSRQFDRSRYGIDKLQARPVFETTWWKGSRITVEGGVRYVDFRDDACCGDPSVQQRIDDGKFKAPPDFLEGYTAAFQRGELTVDTRDPRPASQTGLRLELESELGSNVRRSADNWFRYGGSFGGFLDLKSNRTVSLAVTTLFVDPLSSGGVIPFTEQIVLGGSGPMRGYLYGRLVDRSAAIATLKYRWPIWVYLDGSIQGAVGNVFGPQLEDFKTKLLRVSSAVGVESVGTADHTFEILVGFGTETIDSGANVNSVRLLFGTNRGF